MKNISFIAILLVFITSTKSQSIREYKQITEEEYRLFFPLETQIALFDPTTDYVCILPSNEKDTLLQKEANEFYRQSIIKYYPTVPNQISRIITDKEALKEDLSNINIYAFGTLEGNLWISRFLSKATDFPIKITSDSIMADKVYRGNDYVVSALWFNPANIKHSVKLYIPQSQSCAKSFTNENCFQYTIWQKGEKVEDAYYYLRNHSWYFSNKKDSLLAYRDTNRKWYDFEKLDQFHYRYPKLDQIESCVIDENDIPVDLITLSDINTEYNNISDMQWLRPIAKKYKIIEIGESHHLKYNPFIFKRILFSLNTFDYYPLLVFELQYSFSGYFNYYLSIENDADAKVYRDTMLSKLYKPVIPMFDLIRTWNKLHPERKIHVGCSDIEQFLGKTIKLILNPYLLKIKSDADTSFKIEDSLGGYLSRAQDLIELAKRKNIIGTFPFQTPLYMETVLENLKSSIPIKLDQKKFTDHSDRFKIMIRNVTDSLFLGLQVANQKCIFYGGSEHFRILNDGTDKYATSTEGYFLAHNFQPTKDKVYSICMRTLSLSIEDSVQRVDPSLRYTDEIQLINLFKERKITLNEPVLGPSSTEFENYFYKLSYKYPKFAFRIQNINIPSVLNKYEGFGRFMTYIFMTTSYDYNTTIMLPSSPIGY